MVPSMSPPLSVQFPFSHDTLSVRDLSRLFKIAHLPMHLAGQRRWSILNSPVVRSNKIITLTAQFFTKEKPADFVSELGQTKILPSGNSQITPIQKER